MCEGFQSKEAVVGNLYCNTLAEITHGEQLRQVINRVQYRNGAIESCKACSWYKMCIKTYADLFIRLAAIYFAIFVTTNIR